MSRVTQMTRVALAATLLSLIAGGAVLQAAPPSAESIYGRALGRERELRDANSGATLGQLRSLVGLYESVVLRFPKSAYCDNALWQGANVALLAYERFEQASDRRTAARLLALLRDGYPSSSLRKRAVEQLAALDVDRAPSTAAAVTPAVITPAPPPPPAVVAPAVVAAVESSTAKPSGDSAALVPVSMIREIKRSALPDGVRVSIELDSESRYRYERLENPRRVFIDLKGTRAPVSLQDAVLKFDDDVVREIRLGRHPNNTTRVVMDMEQVDHCSVFMLYNPFRLVIDFKRDAAAGTAAATTSSATAAVPKPSGPIASGLTSPVPGRVPVESARSVAPPESRSAESKSVPAAKEPVPLLSRPTAAVAAAVPTPVAPTTNSNGQFSLARQLGLGVSRIVLDAGHGGHDPGARSNGIEEAELVLDVTLRLRELLDKQPGIEVTLTRSTDQFIPLEERTAIANRNGADLFLSIHANASRNPKARGVETYFLNFASNPEAEAVAARENSASGKTMHSLPEIVRAIALNNKIDESRDFADMVQKSMVHRLGTRNKLLRDLGVKQAPFVVLIGAGMPSVLAEISFVTNKQDSLLLKTPAYRQQIAESLFDAVVRYQRSLKGVRAVAAREE